MKIAAAALLLLACAGAAHAQTTTCLEALPKAQKLYDLGLFDDVANELAPCLAMTLSRATAIQVHSLLARAYLYAEQPEKARKEVSTLLRLDPSFDAGEPVRFAELVERVRHEEQTTQVASVSKTSESLREAPATVVVITGDEIRRRGYLDLEELLHDLPGFDVSRANGVLYSAIYQRGYRSFDNDRLLLLVDGVEQEELTTFTTFVSRQYPLTNIDRVEVVYGPASTMYGANAYTGVISIVTKDPEAFVNEKRSFGVLGQVTSGGYGNHFADVTLAGRNRSGAVAWSLTGNVQRSTERDLSSFDDWDYTFRNFDYRGTMRLTGANAAQFIESGRCAQGSPYVQCNAAAQTVDLTPMGEQTVRALDRAQIQDNGYGFHDRARNWSLFGKVRISNLTIGVDAWRSQEGIASYARSIWINGLTSWTPHYTALYVKYSVPLDAVKLNFFTRYLQTGVDRGSSQFEFLHNYANGFLSVWSLVAPCTAPLDPLPVSCAPAAPWVEKASYGSHSNQIRSEATVAYETQEKFNAVGGLELAKSSIERDFEYRSSGPGALNPGTGPPEQIEHTDAAVYAQGAYRPHRALRFVVAGRLSHDEINNKAGAQGFGTLFTPRAAVIVTPTDSHLTLKAIYAEAFKDPNERQKFGISPFVNEYPSLGLRPERVRNVEASAGWQPNDTMSLQGSVYQAHYTDVVGFGRVAECQKVFGCLRYENRDEFRVRGLEMTGRLRRGRNELWGNYTYTASYQIDPTDVFGHPLLNAQGTAIHEQRIPDIARGRLNVGANTEWSERLSTALRINVVGSRPADPRSPFSQTNAYATADATASYRPSFASDATLQLIVDNVFDKQYYDPGIDAQIGAWHILQAGRTIYLRLTYGLRTR